MLIKISQLLLLPSLLTVALAQYDYEDTDEQGRRLHRRRPNNNGGPCGGRDANGRFLALQYVNVNYAYNCGGGGGYGGGGHQPQQDFFGGGGGEHRPQKPHRPHKPHGGGGGPFGGLFGGGGGGQQSDPIQQDFGSSGGGGLFNKPIFQRPPFGGNNGGGGGGNGGGPLSNLFSGGIINSFSSLFSNANINPSNAFNTASDYISNINPSEAFSSVTNFFNRPSPNPTQTQSNDVQYVQDLNNTPPPNNDNVNNNINNNNLVDEKPVHEEQDPVPEAYNNLRPGQYISASSPFGSYAQPFSDLGNINYNKAIRKVNRQVNKFFNQLFRR